jgi:hypothetical protein
LFFPFAISARTSPSRGVSSASCESSRRAPAATSASITLGSIAEPRPPRRGSRP